MNKTMAINKIMQLTRNKTIHLLKAHKTLKQMRVWLTTLTLPEYLKIMGRRWNEYEQIKNNPRL